MGLTSSCFSEVSSWDAQGSLGAMSPTVLGAQSKQTPPESFQIGLWQCLQSLVQLGKEPKAMTGDFTEGARSPVEWSMLLPSSAYR